MPLVIEAKGKWVQPEKEIGCSHSFLEAEFRQEGQAKMAASSPSRTYILVTPNPKINR